MILITRFLICFILFPCVYVQAQWTEDFSSGSLTHPRSWEGEEQYFRVNGAQQLQSNGPASAATIFIQTASSLLDDTQWKCWIDMDFESSSSNYAKIFLAASSPHLNDPQLEAYYLKVGGISGNTDGVDLYYQKQGVHTLVIRGREGRAGGMRVTLNIKVFHSAGRWSLYTDTGTGTHYELEGSGMHRVLFNTVSFGFMCIHSSTRRDRFYFDNIEITPAPFLLTDYRVIHEKQLGVEFNRIVTGLDKGNLLLNDKPLKEEDELLIEGKRVEIRLTEPLLQGIQVLSVAPFSISSGEQLFNAGLFEAWFIKQALPGQLIMTEIMSDPDPSVDLPVAEYVELYNHSDDTLWLEGYRFADPGKEVVLSFTKLPPRDFLILTSSGNAPLFEDHGKVMPCVGWPNLNNDADTLSLYNKEGLLIDKVVYSVKQYGNSPKKEGGWSLELIHPQEHCKGMLNWAPSEHSRGGTPGRANSLSHYAFDRQPPKLLSVFYEAVQEQWRLQFDEALDQGHLPEVIILSQGNNAVQGLQFASPNQLLIPDRLSVPAGGARDARILQLSDCLGNTRQQEVLLIKPRIPQPGELLINELLFNPYPFGKDFVELYNVSEDYLLLEKLAIENSEGVSLAIPVSIMSPGSYKVLTADSMAVKQFYPHAARGTFVKVNLPAFPDDKGLVRLSLNQRPLDELSYNQAMHHPLLDSKEGFSLERVTWNKPSDWQPNWQSASNSSGGATPGFMNSQSHALAQGNTLFVEPRSISPGTDGYRNFATIRYTLPKPGISVRMDVYSLQGHWIRSLQPSGPADVEGMCIWDGTDAYAQPVSTGLYLLIAEFFDPDGGQWKAKETVSVLSR